MMPPEHLLLQLSTVKAKAALKATLSRQTVQDSNTQTNPAPEGIPGGRVASCDSQTWLIDPTPNTNATLEEFHWSEQTGYRRERLNKAVKKTNSVLDLRWRLPGE